MSNKAFNSQSADQAADWVIKLDTGSLTHDECVEFANWLKTSPVNVDELLLCASLFMGIESCDPALTTDIKSFLEGTAPEVIPLMVVGNNEQIKLTSIPVKPKLPPRFKMPLLATAASIVMIVLGTLSTASLFFLQDTTVTPLYTNTGLGEQNLLELKDGSKVHLNTLSKVSTSITPEVRIVELVEGEAFFEITSDPDRVFRVIAKNTLVEVVGTRFNVKAVEGGVSVDVTEGIVSIGSLNSKSATNFKSIKLTAGQSAFIDSGTFSPYVIQRDIDKMAVWRLKRLVFEANSLEDIVLEFNRYNQSKIIIEDSALLVKKYSGVFATDDPNSFVDFLVMSNDVEVSRKAKEIRIRSKTKK